MRTHCPSDDHCVQDLVSIQFNKRAARLFQVSKACEFHRDSRRNTEHQGLSRQEFVGSEKRHNENQPWAQQGSFRSELLDGSHFCCWLVFMLRSRFSFSNSCFLIGPLKVSTEDNAKDFTLNELFVQFFHLTKIWQWSTVCRLLVHLRFKKVPQLSLRFIFDHYI